MTDAEYETLKERVEDNDLSVEAFLKKTRHYRWLRNIVFAGHEYETQPTD